MTEEQAKFIYKWMVENSNKPISRFEKEALKRAIDKAQTVGELVVVAEAFALAGRKR